jgi:uncharacterized membrane protein
VVLNGKVPFWQICDSTSNREMKSTALKVCLCDRQRHVLHSIPVQIATMLICPMSSSVFVFMTISCDLLTKALLMVSNLDVLVAIWQGRSTRRDTKLRRSHVFSGALWLAANITFIVLIVASCRLRISHSHHVRRCVNIQLQFNLA